MADAIDKNSREEGCENPTEQSPLYDDLEEKYFHLIFSPEARATPEL